MDHNPAEALEGALEPLRPHHHPGITDPRRLGALLRRLREYSGSRLIQPNTLFKINQLRLIARSRREPIRRIACGVLVAIL